MLLESDVPSSATLQRLDGIPGGNGGEPALVHRVPELRALLQDWSRLVVIDAATGTGKTRVVPSEIQHEVQGPVLALTTTTVDVESMQSQTKCPSHYRMGGGREGGAHIDDAKIFITTAGLAARWYASNGEQFLGRYKAVFFDELSQMEHDPMYALLWEVALQQRRTRRLVVVGAGATLSQCLKDRLDDLGAVWLHCHDRPYPVQRNLVSVPNMDLLYQAIAHIASLLFARRETSLIFLPGKLEIENVAERLRALGIPLDSIALFHAELDAAVLAKVRIATDHPRCILATSLAELAITVPDVDHVIPRRQWGYPKGVEEGEKLILAGKLGDPF
jgi:HrpA-like RNA helicase